MSTKAAARCHMWLCDWQTFEVRRVRMKTGPYGAGLMSLYARDRRWWTYYWDHQWQAQAQAITLQRFAAHYAVEGVEMDDPYA